MLIRIQQVHWGCMYRREYEGEKYRIFLKGSSVKDVSSVRFAPVIRFVSVEYLLNTPGIRLGDLPILFTSLVGLLVNSISIDCVTFSWSIFKNVIFSTVPLFFSENNCSDTSRISDWDHVISFRWFYLLDNKAHRNISNARVHSLEKTRFLIIIYDFLKLRKYQKIAFQYWFETYSWYVYYNNKLR